MTRKQGDDANIDNATPSLEPFETARARIAGIAIDSPLIKLKSGLRDDIYLKLENLQPVGSFKVRCAANIVLARRDILRDGVSTASAGNFAQGLAYVGRALDVPVTAYVPHTAAQSKVDALKLLGAQVIALPFEDWWAKLSEPNDDPTFLHPVVEPEGLSGNGTIALEILERLPDVATVITPYGGGGLSVGIAMALAAAGAQTRVVAAETEAGAPLTAAFANGGPVKIDFDSNTFITGMGGPEVLTAIWPLASRFIADTAVVSLDQVADAIRIMARDHHVIAEGAGGAAVAAAIAANLPGPIVCVVSGGHLDAAHLITILQGETP